MPCLIGPVLVLNVGGGIVQFGDTAIISPKSSSKTNGGASGFNVGTFLLTYTALNLNTVVDCNAIDQPIIGNN
jgi:spore germination protein PF